MTDQSNEQSPRLQEYQKRLEELMESAREGIDRQAPEVLDKLAATAKDIARRLEDMARDARQRAAEKEATPESTGTSADPAQGPKAPGEPHPDEPRGDARRCPSASDPLLLP
jgi:uncharacterized protein HemX